VGKNGWLNGRRFGGSVVEDVVAQWGRRDGSGVEDGEAEW
jgi:hypothetical protein